ncbi:MAG TPA: hypothetical protein DDZ67_00090 [Xanthomonadaceae bacterium]|nr:hypothetical protein [Xanthomonadaceae bacterium]
MPQRPGAPTVRRSLPSAARMHTDPDRRRPRPACWRRCCWRRLPAPTTAARSWPPMPPTGTPKTAATCRRWRPLLTPDVEFYHDRSGLSAGREALIASLQEDPCADPAMRLRQVAVAGSLDFHPLAGGYALLQGRHAFRVERAGKPDIPMPGCRSACSGRSATTPGGCTGS